MERTSTRKVIALPTGRWYANLKELGGLGVLNLKIQNIALIMKHLHKFFTHADVPWVKLIWQAHNHNNTAPQACSYKGSFWWRGGMKLYDLYYCLTSCTTNNGDTILLWKDKWCGQALMDKFPQLHSFANDGNITIHKAKHSDSYHSMFQLPLSNIAFHQFTQMCNTFEYLKKIKIETNGISNGFFI